MELFADMKSFERAVKAAVTQKEDSLFTLRTDASSAEQYFQVCYGQMICRHLVLCTVADKR